MTRLKNIPVYSVIYFVYNYSPNFAEISSIR